ncbi:hypothetical protein [Litchfieldia salsa]|uniref:Sigma-X negative effector n=1 Tax=Litchfieldia salsa TaxID=930152 RepID=A0A1H0WGF2_9BACI|nr:hypothetical protein [Litchfieldia salsa]SDP89643.1 hypothetical protein SAMN05216565_11152 [Litchfieldia salsa]
MKRSEWSDEQLERLLSEMPQIKDNRKPQDIYQNISTKVNKRRKTPWLVPSIAGIAAVILIIMMGPSFINEMNSGSESSSKESADFANETKEAESGMMSMAGKEEARMAEDTKKEAMMDITSEQKSTYVLWEEDLENKTLLTFTVPISSAQFYTTVSVLTENDGRSPIDKYNEYIPMLNHLLSENYNIWGAETFALDYLRFSEETQSDGTKNIIATIPAEANTPSFSPTLTEVFNITMTESFRWLQEEYKKVVYMVDGQIGAEIGQTGIVEEGVDLVSSTQKGYFMYANKSSEKKFLSHSLKSYDTIEEAFEAMKLEEKRGDFVLNPSIPNEMVYQLGHDEGGKNLTISFQSTLENNDEYIFALEAMLLTAKEFGFESVTFEGDIDKVGTISIGISIPVPVSPNPIDL